MKKLRLGILSAPPINQETMTDMTSDWGDATELVFSSIIESRTKSAIEPYLVSGGDRILMFVLEDGTHDRISVNKLQIEIEKRLLEMKDEVDLVFLACAGDFPKIEAPILFVQPNLVIRNMVKNILHPDIKLGVIIPDSHQISHVHNSWLPYTNKAGMKANQLIVKWAPPGDVDAIQEASRKLKEQSVDLIVVECLGFKEETRKIIVKEANVPVMLVRTIMTQFVKELTTEFY